jgi:hypothetical protein
MTDCRGKQYGVGRRAGPQMMAHVAVSGGPLANGVGAAQAHSVASLPPVGSLFASFLGYNPLQSLLGSQASTHVTSAQWHTLTGKSFFPHLIASPLHQGLVILFAMAIAMSLVAAVFSSLRGPRFMHNDFSTRT